MKRCAPAGRPADLPDWYWTRGLHDVRITLVEALELPCDYRRSIPRRSCLKLHLNAAGALYETRIRCISLFDYEILAGTLPQTGGWWLGDELRQEDGRHILEVEWTDNHDSYSFTIRFGEAEVELR